jgi:DNA-binding CsgD family transcriptional regulator
MAAKRSAQIDKDELSAREREVLRLLAEGRRTAEIADLLGISPKTVETYRSRLMNKLDIDSLSGLVKFAIRAGLVSPES